MVPLLDAASPVLLVLRALAQQCWHALCPTIHLDEPGILKVASCRHGIQIRLENRPPAAERRVPPPASRFGLQVQQFRRMVAASFQQPNVRLGHGEAVIQMTQRWLFAPSPRLISALRTALQQPLADRAEPPDVRRRTGAHAADPPLQVLNGADSSQPAEHAPTDSTTSSSRSMIGK